MAGRRSWRPAAIHRLGEDLLAAVPMAWLAVFFLAPLGFTVVFFLRTCAFGDVSSASPRQFPTALSGFYLVVFLRTIQFAITGCLLCLLAPIRSAYFIARHAGRFRSLALAIVLVPYFTSFLIRVMSWQILLSRGGPLEKLANALHIYGGPVDLLDTKTAVFIGLVYVYLPIAVVPLYVVLERIPQALVESGRDLGATRWQVFLYVILPISRPGIATAVLLTAVPMLGEMVIPRLLGGSRGVLMGQAISSQYLQSQNYAVGSAMAVLVLLAIGAVVGLLARATRGFEDVAADAEGRA